MKKLLALALLVAFLGATVIGCGGSPTTGPKKDGGAPATDKKDGKDGKDAKAG